MAAQILHRMLAFGLCWRLSCTYTVRDRDRVNHWVTRDATDFSRTGEEGSVKRHPLACIMHEGAYSSNDTCCAGPLCGTQPGDRTRGEAVRGRHSSGGTTSKRFSEPDTNTPWRLTLEWKCTHKVSKVQWMSKQTQRSNLVCAVLTVTLGKEGGCTALHVTYLPLSCLKGFTVLAETLIYFTAHNLYFFMIMRWGEFQKSCDSSLQGVYSKADEKVQTAPNVVSAFPVKSFTSEGNLLKLCYWIAAQAHSHSLWKKWHPRQLFDKCCWAVLLTWVFSQCISKPITISQT